MSGSVSRNASIDYLRFAGALGIVLFHAGLPDAWIGLSALPMFVTLIVYYGLDRSLGAHARRLLIPWLIWSAIYAAAKLSQAMVQGNPWASEFESWMLLTGTSLHLWFLPFAFLFLVAARGVWLRSPLWVLWGIAVPGSCAAIWAFQMQDMPIPLPQWCATLPAAFAGAMMARTGRFGAALATLGIGAAVLIVLGWDEATWQLAIAAGAIALALAVPLPQTRVSAWMAQVSFGVYLIHPLVYAFGLYVLPRYSWALYTLVVVASILGTMLLRRWLPASV